MMLSGPDTSPPIKHTETHLVGWGVAEKLYKGGGKKDKKL